MFFHRHILRRMALLLCFSFAACAGGSSDFENTHAIEFVLADGAVAQAVKTADVAADPALWNVRCVSLDTEGVRTTASSGYDADALGFRIEHVPDEMDTVCHIVEQGGALVSTISIADGAALGGARDVFRLRKDARATLTYDVQLRASVANGADFLPAAAETRADLEGGWGVDCHDVRDIVTDDVAPDMRCPEEVDGSRLYLHLVRARGASSEARVAYGIWRSEDGFAACGLTEGLDALHEGWSIEDPAHAAPFRFSPPFDAISPSSATSEELMEAIRSAGNEGLTPYDEYVLSNPEICENEDRCAIAYYGEMRAYAFAHPGDLCWPELIFAFGDDGRALASMWSFRGGSARPIGRVDFIEAFQYGNETYMRNLTSHASTAYAGGVPVQCRVREEYLVAVEIPDSDEDGRADDDADDAEIKAGPQGADDLIAVGTQLEARYQARVDAASFTGRHDNVCRQDLGLADERTDVGFYADVIFVSISAE